MFEKKRQEFIFVFSKIYSEYPDGLADILGKAFQICETSVIESFLDIGPNTLEIIQCYLNICWLLKMLIKNILLFCHAKI